MESDETQAAPAPKRQSGPRLSRVEWAFKLASEHENPAKLLDLLDSEDAAKDALAEGEMIAHSAEQLAAWKKAHAERSRFVDSIVGQPESTMESLRVAVQSRVPKKGKREKLDAPAAG